MKRLALAGVAFVLLGCASLLRPGRGSDEQILKYVHAQRELRPQYVLDALSERSVVIGMTDKEVVLAWGKPESVNRTAGSWGVHEQWVYGSIGRYVSTRRYIYLENGVVTSWQD